MHDGIFFGHKAHQSNWNCNGGVQHLFRFENGMGASVVRHDFSYGGNDGLWELAVIVWDGEDFALTYDTPVTDDVLGHLDPADVQANLNIIQTLRKERSQ